MSSASASRLAHELGDQPAVEASPRGPRPPQRRVGLELGDLQGRELEAVAGGVGLEAAAIGAVALAGAAVGLDDHVPELGGGPAEATVDAPARHDAAADAGAQREHEHLVDAHAGAEAVLGDAGHGGVVVDRDRHAVALLQDVAQRHVRERQVGRDHQPSPGEVDRRGGADADGVGAAALRKHRVDARHDVGETRLRGVDDGGSDRAREQAHALVHDTHGELGAAEVDPDDAQAPVAGAVTSALPLTMLVSLLGARRSLARRHRRPAAATPRARSARQVARAVLPRAGYPIT